MQTLCVVGPEAADLVERLVPKLDGRTATVERLAAGETDPPRSGGSFGLTDDGLWVGAGEGRSARDLLDSLAADYEYALLAGIRLPRVPTVAVGGADGTDETELDERLPSAAAADLDSLAALVEEADPYVTLESLVRRAKASPRADRAGAVATFTGRVRAKDADDDARTVRLDFQKYEGVADERMETISEELRARDGVHEVLMHHRTGPIEDGEDIVFVVVLAGHRAEAFRTVEDGIDRLKDEVPIFKKETTADEEFWVHERA